MLSFREPIFPLMQGDKLEEDGIATNQAQNRWHGIEQFDDPRKWGTDDVIAPEDLPDYYHKYQAALDDYRNLPSYEGRENKTPYKLYHHSAGETEARVVQDRLDLTPQQRADRAPHKDFNKQSPKVYRRVMGVRDDELMALQDKRYNGPGLTDEENTRLGEKLREQARTVDGHSEIDTSNLEIPRVLDETPYGEFSIEQGGDFDSFYVVDDMGAIIHKKFDTLQEAENFRDKLDMRPPPETINKATGGTVSEGEGGKPEGLLSSVYKKIPANMRIFAETLFGEEGPITEADYSEEDLQFLRREYDKKKAEDLKDEEFARYQLANTQEGDLLTFKDGKIVDSTDKLRAEREEDVAYYDRTKGKTHMAPYDYASEEYDHEGNWVSSTMQSFQDPSYRAGTSLGRFYVVQQDDGSVRIEDTYDWTKAPKDISLTQWLGIVGALKSPEQVGNVIMRLFMPDTARDVNIKLPESEGN